MKIFQCGNCEHPLFFENTFCENCGLTVGYDDISLEMKSFDPSGLKIVSKKQEKKYRFCKNKEYNVCNWLVDTSSNDDYCVACSLNRTIPNLTNKKNHEKWHKLEYAKHRMVYQLQRFKLDFPSKLMDPENGLCFDFLAKQEGTTVMTGHAEGVITILLSEADSVLREQMRLEMSEAYRSLIGHFRHEVGHYYWDQLVATDPLILEKFRGTFGDERKNYSQALQEYYETGGENNWSNEFISKYATAHPWEDWAETWAHYLHIMDITETAYYFGLKVEPINESKAMSSNVTFDPYQKRNFADIVKVCIPLIFASNAINRSMGIPDVYPFIITDTVIEKMAFIHNLICDQCKKS